MLSRPGSTMRIRRTSALSRQAVEGAPVDRLEADGVAEAKQGGRVASGVE
ncbi:hypothetical protein ABWH91_12010 [Phycisphaerales bacterium ac7]